MFSKHKNLLFWFCGKGLTEKFWEMNLRNDTHTCWTIWGIVRYEHLKNFRCLQQDLNPWPLRCRYRAILQSELWSHWDLSKSIYWTDVFAWKEWWVKEIFVQCGWEMNLRNDTHTCWTISTIVKYEHLKNFRCLEQDSNPWPLQCRSYQLSYN